jgi:GntR family transcriptional regulator
MSRRTAAAKQTHVADLNRSAVSRYIQLATLFRRRIESGQWKVGEQIPTVDTLSVDCGVARATIRQALGLIESEGLISRRRAKGTFVTRRPQEQLWCEVETNWSGLLSSRQGATIEVLQSELVEAPLLVPHPIGELAPSYRHLRRRHSREGVPFLLADVYIDQRLTKKIPASAYTTKTALRLVSGIEGVKISDARQTLTIGSADIETAEHLNLPLNAHVAHVHRSAVDQHGNLILIANGIYRGDVVRVDIKLK